jgi:hypothetical protein
LEPQPGSKEPQFAVPTGQMNITSDQLKKIQTGELWLAIIGGIRYTDMFSPRIEPYETLYCMNYVAKGGMRLGECSADFPRPFK